MKKKVIHQHKTRLMKISLDDLINQFGHLEKLELIAYPSSDWSANIALYYEDLESDEAYQRRIEREELAKQRDLDKLAKLKAKYPEA